MAKSGLDYFPLACNFEDKIELIEAEFGLRGIAIIVKLYQKIYGEFGYYCDWNDEVALLFSRKACGLKEGDNVVSEVVKAAFKRGVFNKDMFDKYGIITSAGIQKRYFEAKKRNVQIEVEETYLLLSATQIPKNVNIISKNVCRNKKNVCRNQQSKVKESKEKESRVEKSKDTASQAYYPNDEKLNRAFADYVQMRKLIKKPMTDKAVSLAMSKLQKLAALPFSETMDNDLAIQILEQSVMSSWQGLFPLKGNRQDTGQSILDEWRNA